MNYLWVYSQTVNKKESTFHSTEMKPLRFLMEYLTTFGYMIGDEDLENILEHQHCPEQLLLKSLFLSYI